jgi:hypothetical protein
MPKQAPEPPAPIRLSDNTIWEGKFYNAGEVLPVSSVEELTPNLRPLVVTGEPEPEEPNVARGSYQTGIIYEMTDDGRLGRALRRNVQRQVAQLEAENERQDWIEEEVASAELPFSVAEDLQAEHENAIALAKAQMAADARRSDEVSDAAAAAAELPRMYVKRGGRHYAPADKARLLPGEDVFVRQPDGRFQCIGITDARADLPDLPIEI